MLSEGGGEGGRVGALRESHLMIGNTLEAGPTFGAVATFLNTVVRIGLLWGGCCGGSSIICTEGLTNGRLAGKNPSLLLDIPVATGRKR